MTIITLSDEQGEPGEVRIEASEGGERLFRMDIPKEHLPTDPADLIDVSRGYADALEAWESAQ